MNHDRSVFSTWYGTSALIVLLLATLGFVGSAAAHAAPRYDAEVVTEENRIYRNMAIDGVYEMTLVFKTTGTEDWVANPQPDIRLEIKPEPGFGPWGTSGRIAVPTSVNIVENKATFTFNVTAFDTSGFFPFRAQMLWEGNYRFGEVFEDEIEIHDMSQAIVIDGEDFREGPGGRSWIPAGATATPWFGSHTDPCSHPTVRGPGQQFWCEFQPNDDPDYDEDLAPLYLDETLKDLARQGVNTIRIGGIGEIFETSEGQFEDAYCDHFNHMLDNAAQYGIRAIINMPGPSRFQSMYDAKFCVEGGPIECAHGSTGFPTDLKALILEPPVRDFTIARMWNFIDQCGLLDRPEILAYRLFDEPITQDFTQRSRDFLVEQWNDYLDEEFGCVDAALDAFGFDLAQPSTLPDQTCGPAGDLLCPPDDTDFCEERVDAWGQLAREHRRFFDARYEAAYRDIVEKMKDTTMPLCGPGPCECALTTEGCSEQRAFMTSSIPTSIWKNPSQQEADCKNAGHWADPSWSSDVFDYVALNVADFNDKTAFGYEPILRLWIDYARGDKPVVLHEFGSRWDFPFFSDDGDRDDLQQRLVLEQVLGFADRFSNGAQFQYYRDFEGLSTPLHGAKRINGSARPIFGDFPMIMDSLKHARDAVSVAPTEITVDPYSKVLLGSSILDQLAAHEAAAVAGLVRVSTPGEVDPPSPAPGVCSP